MVIQLIFFQLNTLTYHLQSFSLYSDFFFKKKRNGFNLKRNYIFVNFPIYNYLEYFQSFALCPNFLNLNWKFHVYNMSLLHHPFSPSSCSLQFWNISLPASFLLFIILYLITQWVYLELLIFPWICAWGTILLSIVPYLPISFNAWVCYRASGALPEQYILCGWPYILWVVWRAAYLSTTE